VCNTLFFALLCFCLLSQFAAKLSYQLLFFLLEKARARWAKLKRFVKSGAYLDDWNAPVSLVTVANTIQRMNHKEKTMIEKGVSVYINTSRSGPPDTARSKLSRTSGSSETSETKIIDRFQKELSKRDLAMSSKSMSRPVLISSNRKRRQIVGTFEAGQTTQWPKEKQRPRKHTHKTKDRATRTPIKTGGDL
jgi:hypothetical protein